LIKSAEGETTALGNEFLKVAIQYKYDQECEIKRRKAAGSVSRWLIPLFRRRPPSKVGAQLL